MRRIGIIATVVLLAASTAALRAAGTNASPSPSSRLAFDAFRIISERNIFNPNRYPGSDNRNTRREPDRRTRSESFALVGTMSSERGRFAFFDGSSADYRKVLGANEQIGGYIIAEVTPEHVSLQSTNQHEIKLPVGMQMRRFEEGEWEVTARTESSGTASATSPAAGSTTSGSAGGDEEVLKRLMQRREQEGGTGESQGTPEPPPSPANPERTPEPSGPEAEILKRLQQQREQELNK